MINRSKRIFKAIYDTLGDPRKAPIVIMGLALLVLFLTGVSAVLYNRQNHTNTRVTGIQQEKRIAEEAAYKACLQSKPARTDFIKEIIEGYNQDATNALNIRNATKPGTRLWNIRDRTWHTKKDIADALGKFLPIRCRSVIPTRNQQSGKGVSRQQTSKERKVR